MDNFNLDENTMKNIKNMVDSGNISDAISNISPEMIQNFSKMLSNQNINNSNGFNNQQNTNNSQNNTSQDSSQTESKNQTIDFSNIDPNTIMKLSSVIGKMKNTNNDPRANLLNSLKPYLRDTKKDKLDNYINLLNVSKIAEIIKDNNKIKGFVLPYNIAPYKVHIIYNEKNKEAAEKLYYYLLDNNIQSIIDDRENLSIGSKINDVYVLGTPKMIILGNRFDGINYEIEDVKNNTITIVTIENILDKLK